MADQYWNKAFQFFDSNGDPLNAGTINTYDATTTDARTVYKDSAAGSSWTQPITLGTDGRLTDPVYIPTGAWKYILKNSAGTIITTEDNIPGAVATVSTTYARPQTPFLTKSADYTIVSDDLGKLVSVDATGGNVTLTLLSAITAGDGKHLWVQLTSAVGKVIIAGAGGQTVNGASSVTIIRRYAAIILISDGANWSAIGTDLPVTILSKAANYTVLGSDNGRLILCNPSTPWTLSLPAAATVGDGFTIGVKITTATTGAVTIDGSASETIDGATTRAVTGLYRTEWYRCDGSNWHVSHRSDEDVELTVTSASGDILGAASRYVAISGTTTITSFGTAVNKTRWARATGAFQITYNGTSLITPTAANITTVAGDTFLVVSDSSGNARIYNYQRADGTPLRPTIQPFGFMNGYFTVTENSPSSNILTIALKTLAGGDPSSTDPVTVSFRTTTVTSGAYVTRQVTGALSVAVSAGSTLGFSNAGTGLIHAGFIDNAGTVELAVSQDGAIWTEDRLVSTTAEGGAGAADSRTVLYSTTARTNVACRLGVVILITTGATAGNWSAAPTRVTTVGDYPDQPYKNTVKAWGNAIGAGTVLSDSFNISSITDQGTGDITFTFAVAMGNTNYAVNVTVEKAAIQTAYINNSGSTATGSVRFLSEIADGTDTDPGQWCVSVVGR